MHHPTLGVLLLAITAPALGDEGTTAAGPAGTVLGTAGRVAGGPGRGEAAVGVSRW